MARKVLICENEDCAYRFSEAETSFLCCPKCGALVSSNFARVNLEDRARLYGEILSFRKHLRISNRIISAAGCLIFSLLVLEGILFYYTGAYGLRGREARYFSDELMFRKVFFPVLIYTSLTFIDSDLVNKHDYKGRMWIFHTIKAKVIMGMILYTLLFLLLRYHVPYYYWKTAYLIGDPKATSYDTPYDLTRELVFYYLYLFSAVFQSTYTLWDDWYSRYLCEKMSPKEPMRFNRWG